MKETKHFTQYGRLIFVVHQTEFEKEVITKIVKSSVCEIEEKKLQEYMEIAKDKKLKMFVLFFDGKGYFGKIKALINSDGVLNDKNSDVFILMPF
ncbi:MAG: hypothetical protein WCP85_32110 [Mariniphaga sp.]